MGRKARVLIAIVSLGSASSCALLIDANELSGGIRDDTATDGGARQDDAAAESGPVPCAVDLGTDPKNCGACGRVCDVACTEGVCDVRVEVAIAGLTGLAATPMNVAWSTSSSVSLQLTDGGVLDLLKDTVGSEISYGSGGILTGLNSGGAGNAYLCRDTGCVRLQREVPALKWVVGESGNAQMLSNDGNVYSCGLGECTTASVSVPKSEGPFVDLAVLGGRFFWVTGNAAGKVRSSPRAAVFKADGGYGVNGSPITDLAVNVPTPRGIAGDSLGIVWTESGSGRIRRCPIAADGTCSAPPTTVYQGAAQDVPTRIVSDGENVYWIAETARRVLRCAASGCIGTPVVVMRDLGDPKRIALSLERVYVADYGTSRVVSVPK